MSTETSAPLQDPGVEAMLDRLAAAELHQSNCMFQLAVMLARIATESCDEAYKEDVAQALLGLIRGKPRGSVVRLFGSPAGAPHQAARQAIQG